MKIRIKDIADFIASVFFPNRCIFCDELIDPFDDYCDACGDRAPFITGEVCPKCGSSKADCTCRRNETHYYDKLISALYYEDSVKSCIHRFKFKDERNISKPLAVLMARRLKEYASDISFDYITYVPMYKTAERRRGFNQSKLLAREISRISGIEFADKMLVKIYNTDCQHECSGLERTGNLVGVFDVNVEYELKDKNILLVDDIKTSGATLNECCKMLRLYDVNSIICLTAAVRKSKIDEDKTKEERGGT